MERHLLYIINPISGTRAKVSLQAHLGERTRLAGLRFMVQPSAADGNYDHFVGIIREEQITDIIIAGGDGTINGAIRGLKSLELPFGILPCGSGNGLALGAGISKNIDRALDVVFRGNSKWTDAFEVNGQFACMLCGLGFDAQVAHDFANDPARGLATYIKKTIAHFFRARAYPFTITSGADCLTTKALFISIANSNQFGNHFTIAPKASLTDGLLDIVVVGALTKLNLLLQAMRQVGGLNPLYTTNIEQSNKSVLYFQTDLLTIANPGRAPIHIDGDPVEVAELVDVRILKSCFRLIYP